MNIQIINDAFRDLLDNSNPAEVLLKLAGIVVTVIFIFLVFNGIRYFLGKFLQGKLSDQRTFMIKKGINYTGFVVALLFVFNRMGIDTSAILGAAGIAGIVLGFAAQTSVSSFISGFFLLSEKPFTVGDAVKINDISGIVLSVDLLSVKLRTYDNLFVRIPNETIIKGNVINVSRFPIRRLDLSFDVAYKEDLERVQGLLLSIAAENQYCLDNPAPFFGIDKFNGSGITVLFNIWFEKTGYWNLKNSIMMQIKIRFEEEAIEIPYQKIDININKEQTNG